VTATIPAFVEHEMVPNGEPRRPVREHADPPEFSGVRIFSREVRDKNANGFACM
jgi:hypothetical protein